MRTVPAFSLLLGLGLAASPASEAPAWGASQGGDLFVACNSEPGTTGDLLCNAYFNGLIGGIQIDQVGNEQGTPICIGEEMHTNQMREAFKTFVTLHPETMNLDRQ